MKSTQHTYTGMAIARRLHNMFLWAWFMADACVHVFVPSNLCMPLSCNMFVDPETLALLSSSKRAEVWHHVVMAGLASLAAFGAFGLGFAGLFRPQDVLLRDLPFKIRKEECSICLRAMRYDDNVVVLTCNHAFHNDCLTKWISHNSACPMCRRSVWLIRLDVK